MRVQLLEKVKCSVCGSTNMRLDPPASPGMRTIDSGALTCSACGHSIAVLDGIIENAPSPDGQLDIWDGLYGVLESDLSDVIKTLERAFDNPEALKSYYDIARAIERLDVPLGSSIELGCGSGAFSLVLKKLGLVEEVTLLDYSLPALKSAARLFSYFDLECTLVYSSLESLPFRDDSFDLALSGGVIEHYATLSERLSCLAAHLRAAPLAYVQAPDSSLFYWVQRAGVTLVKGGWPFGYEWPVSMREMKLLTRLADAEIAGVDYHYFLSLLLLKKPYLAKLRWFRNRVWFTVPMRTEVALLVKKAVQGLPR